MPDHERGEMRIGELASAANVTPRTVRHYEQLGLLRPHERASSGYRYFTEYELARLEKIGKLKELGLTLDEIATVIDLYSDDPTGVRGKRRVLEILQGHLDKTRQRRAGLERFERELEDNIATVERLLSEAEGAAE